VAVENLGQIQKHGIESFIVEAGIGQVKHRHRLGKGQRNPVHIEDIAPRCMDRHLARNATGFGDASDR